jgi:steroid 5-alpha reductase family enzyme
VSGLAPLARFLAGGAPGPGPEAQEPPPGPDGAPRVAGPFRYTRHPANLSALGFWLCPRMTANRATLAALATAYALLGSLHEDRRLRRAHGAAYAAYRRRVPLFWPRRPGW